MVERRSLAGELSPSRARPAADGWPLMSVNRPLQVSQLFETNFELCYATTQNKQRREL